MVGTFETYAKIFTKREGRRVLESVFIQRKCVNTGRVNVLDHPKEKDE